MVLTERPFKPLAQAAIPCLSRSYCGRPPTSDLCQALWLLIVGSAKSVRGAPTSRTTSTTVTILTSRLKCNIVASLLGTGAVLRFFLGSPGGSTQVPSFESGQSGSGSCHRRVSIPSTGTAFASANGRIGCFTPQQVLSAGVRRWFRRSASSGELPPRGMRAHTAHKKSPS